MVRPCCICGIKKGEASSKGILFLRFPSIKNQVHNIWVKAIREHSSKPLFKPKKNSKICSQHFQKDCFNTTSKNRLWLKSTSKPTIFDVGNLAEKENEQFTAAPVDQESIDSEKNDLNKIQDDPPSDMEDNSSDSLSPPPLQPCDSQVQQERSSDFEENICDPPDLDMYNGNDYDDTGMTTLADMDIIKMDHIGSVADVLGPDPYSTEDIAIDQSDSMTGEELVEVDGQKFLSFTSAEEMQEYEKFARAEGKGKLTKTRDFKQIKGWRNKFQLNQLTPSSSPVSCPSPIQPDQSTSNSDAPLTNTNSSSCNASSVGGEDDEEDEEVTMFEVIPPDVPTSSSSEVIKNEPLMTEPVPVMQPDGFMSDEFAKWAASAVDQLNSIEAAQFATGKLKGEKKCQHSAIQKERTSKLDTVELTEKNNHEAKRPSSRESDSVPTVEMNFDDSADHFVIQEESYEEEYGVPSLASELPAAKCGKLFCRLGCVCDSLADAKHKPKISTEHCSLPECMLQCVCGYQPGKPSSRKCFASLLKGNESFYSKIEWTSGRRRRERRVPERFSEYHLGTDTPVTMSHNGRSSLNPDNKSKSASGRGVGSSQRSRSPSPFKNGLPPNRSDAVHQRVYSSNGRTSSSMTTRPVEPFRVKVSTHQIKLLRWDSFVSLKKVYVAPDQDIFCMEHTVYNCPCIETNRRILRIASKYVPLSGDSPSPKKISPVKDSVKNPTKISDQSTNPPVKNVAKKHTHPCMRFAPFAKPRERTTSPSPPVPSVKLVEPVTNPLLRPMERKMSPTQSDAIPKTTSMSKMRRLLQDERFQLKKLMTEEKTRAFDEEVDLVIRQGQTVQLVAWIRFHRIYHAGRMHIRFLSRRAGPVILVMRPTEIVAADITCDIQTMDGDPDAPEIVKELLDPFISPEETSRYAFLLCDGVKWELVGCLTLKVPGSPPSSEPSGQHPPEAKSVPSGVESKSPPPVVRQILTDEKLAEKASEVTLSLLPEEPMIDTQEQSADPRQLSQLHHHLTQPLVQAVSQLGSQAVDVEAEEVVRARAVAREEKVRQLEKRLSELKNKLNTSTARNFSSMMKGMKNRYRPGPYPRPVRPAEQQRPHQHTPTPEPASSHQDPDHRRSGKRAHDSNYLTPNQCILPDDIPEVTIVEVKKRPNPLHLLSDPVLPHPAIMDQVAKKPPVSDIFPATEKLAMFTRMVESGGDVKFSCDVKFPFLNESAMFDSTPDQPAVYSQPPSVPKPKPRPKPAPLLPTPQTVSISLPVVQSRPPEVKLLKLQPLGTSIPSGVVKQGSVQRIRILPQQPLLDGVRLAEVKRSGGIEPSVIQKQRLHWSNKGVIPPLSQKTVSIPSFPVAETVFIPDSSINRLQSDSHVPMKNTIFNNAQSILCKVLKPSTTTATSDVTTTTVTLTQPNLSSSSNSQESTTTSTSTSVTTASDSILADPESPSATIFPKILIAQVSSVQSAKGIVQSLKIILDSAIGANRETCPTRASMLLPLQKEDDQWCLVAIDHVPDCGLRVPGVTGYIPAKILERAASAAVERKARVSFPLHVQAKPVGSVSKMTFGVYGTPQLPRHVFLGPFPLTYLERCAPFQTCMILIQRTKPITSAVPEAVATNSSDTLKSTSVVQVTPSPPPPPSLPQEETGEPEKTRSTSPSTTQDQPVATTDSPLEVVPDTPKETVPVVDLDSNTSSEQEAGQNRNDVAEPSNSVNNSPSPSSSSSSDEDVEVVATISKQGRTDGSTDSKVDSQSNSETPGMDKSDSNGSTETDSSCSSSKSEADIEKENRPVSSSSSSVASSPNDSANPAVQPIFQKPLKVWSASVPGLPPTTVTLMSEGLILVRHPTIAGEIKQVKSLDEAKLWLRSFARPNPPLNEKPQSLSATDDSNSSSGNSHAEDGGRQKATVTKKTYVAQIEGLPATTMTVKSENHVQLKHPMSPETIVDFPSINAAKQWLVDLAMKRKNKISKPDEDTPSDDESDSYSSDSDEEDEEIDVGGGQSQEESQDQNGGTADSESSRKPKRVRRLTEKARILAASQTKKKKKKKKNRTHLKISQRSQFQGGSPRSHLLHSSSSSGKRSITQQQLHIRKEQERRGLLCRLLQDLDALLAPGSGTRAKIVVLKNATATIKSLEAHSQYMDEQYNMLKRRRTDLLTQRERIFGQLPMEVQQIFNSLMDSLSIPTRHLTLTETSKRSRSIKTEH